MAMAAESNGCASRLGFSGAANNDRYWDIAVARRRWRADVLS